MGGEGGGSVDFDIKFSIAISQKPKHEMNLYLSVCPKYGIFQYQK